MPTARQLRLAPLFVVLLALGVGAGAAGQDTSQGFALLGQEIAPGSRARLSFLAEPSFIKEALDMNVLVARGVHPGPSLCVTAAVHGDELNGVEIARRVLDEIEPGTLSGTLISVPIVNVWGFRSGNRYLADRRDLNRAFPGSLGGSMASRIANALFEGVIRHCDVLLDLHTGSAERANLPQIRVDLTNATARELADHFAVGVVLGGAGPSGSLRRAASDAGVVAILYEAGGPNRFEKEEIARGIDGVRNVMEQLRMLGDAPPPADEQRVYRSSSWVRAIGGGIFLTDRVLGEVVASGDLLGHVTDPVTSQRFDIVTPFAGTLIGMAYPQVVLPGFGLFHIGRHEGDGAESSDTE